MYKKVSFQIILTLFCFSLYSMNFSIDELTKTNAASGGLINNEKISPNEEPVEVQGITGESETVITAFVDVTSSLNLREGPSTSTRIITSLTPNTELIVLRQENGWTNVTLPTGQTGWVSSRYVGFRESSASNSGDTIRITDPTQNTITPPSDGLTGTQTPQRRTGRITASQLNVRSGPGTNNRAFTTVSNGQNVTIIGENDRWYQVILEDGREGWVSGRYVSVTGPAQDTPGGNTGDTPGGNTGDTPGGNTGDAPGGSTGDTPRRPPIAGSNFPQRPADAISGSQAMARANQLSGSARQNFYAEEFQRGNVPDATKTFKTVTFQKRGGDGRMYDIEIYVSSDYVAIGSNEDNVRVSLRPNTAQRIAEMYNCILPTDVFVDEIYRSADIKLSPRPLPPGSQMTTVPYLERHDQRVDEQLTGRTASNPLIAGHKKDIVIPARTGKVAIYGWHRSVGDPIQPYSNIHGDTYFDYSHGTRFIRKTCKINGSERDLTEVLNDRNLASAISRRAITSGYIIRYPY